MKVKDIIISTANILNLKKVIEYLNNEIELTTDIQEELNNLLLAVNMTNNNIATHYIELIDKVKIYNDKDVLLYSLISDKDIIEIKKVYNSLNEEIDFDLTSTGIFVTKGNISIEFSYFPNNLTIDDSIDYYTKVNTLTMSLGVAGEYLFLKGAVDDAYMWDKRFKSNLFSLLRPKRNIRIPARRWQ